MTATEPRVAATHATATTVVRHFGPNGEDVPPPKDGYTDEQLRRAFRAVAWCFGPDAEVDPTRSSEFFTEIAHQVLVALGGLPERVARPPVLSALACGVEQEITGALCKVVGPHDLHDYDGLPDWAEPTDTETPDGP